VTLFCLALIPWLVFPLLITLRSARSRNVAKESAHVPPDAPLVSVIVPARNEARNIESCLRAILASIYAPLQVIVVDDHSTDDTATIVRAIAHTDHRVTLIQNPDLPPDWFGKQWACQNGANAASGAFLLFVDADTKLGPHAIARSVNAAQRTHADLFSLLSYQEMDSFWERILQPQVLSVIAIRYGGTETVNRAKHPRDKIASGQFIMVRTPTYRELDGHARVRTHVAEDVQLAQLYFAAGKKTVLQLGQDDVRTRMYTSRQEIIDGWRKNIFAGGRDTVPFGTLGLLVFPIALLTPPIIQLIPFAVLAASLLELVPHVAQLWSIAAIALSLIGWLITYAAMRTPLRYALAYPLGAAVTTYLFASAIKRGQRVAWKGRLYDNNNATAHASSPSQ
jgi:chlorobactene glucosyltransferase